MQGTASGIRLLAMILTVAVSLSFLVSCEAVRGAADEVTVEALTEAFNRADADGDRTISEAEWSAYTQVLGAGGLLALLAWAGKRVLSRKVSQIWDVLGGLQQSEVARSEREKSKADSFSAGAS